MKVADFWTSFTPKTKRIVGVICILILLSTITVCAVISRSKGDKRSDLGTSEIDITGFDEDDNIVDPSDLSYKTEANYKPEKYCSDGGADGSVEYVRYTYVKYKSKDSEETYIATVCKGADGYSIRNDVGDFKQVTQLSADGKTIVFDKMGFMQMDASKVIKAAENQNKWVVIE